MKLNKQQISALARKIIEDISKSNSDFNNEVRKSPLYLETIAEFNREVDNLPDIIKKNHDRYNGNACIVDSNKVATYIGTPLKLNNITSKRTQIEDAIILKSVDNQDIEAIISSIKSMFE